MKVIGFDNWTGGSRHFERLVPPLSAAGVEFILVHLGSWGNDPNRPREEMIGSLRVRDISYYGRMSFDDIVKAEQPDAAILFSTRTFAHRAFMRYCHLRGIPTLHAYHGLVRVQATDGRARVYKPHPIGFLKFALSRVGKLLTKTWPVYARSLWDARAPLSDWIRFAVDIRDFALGLVDKPSAPDARATKCCVYTAADIPHAMSHYGFQRSDVVTVGNPDLMAFGLETDMIGSGLTAGPALTQVMYIDTALSATGLIFGSDAEYVEHIAGLKDSLARQGKQLLLKPHPDTRRRGIDKALAARGVLIVENADFVSALRQCCACIAETTTLGLIPAVLGMPLMLARNGRLRALQFGAVLASYSRARYLDDAEQFSTLLEQERRECDSAKVRSWIDENTGPLPASDMPRRVTDVLLQLIRSARSANSASTVPLMAQRHPEGATT